ncbi:hypothetical protein L596_014255 [Steinernema carpocapsae]|uniref:Aldehyde oxidase/xanthine dehydrogenase first molybdopterin binding domain-containing protein n=1 Tax=Steinernema carpocapsae TaxID=34508 RepID=A0A4U5NC67_STECR|nr:hypothetical protein L596_014255 [Steinernema carpocapsae]
MARGPALVTTYKLNKPLSGIFSREKDMKVTGGRHPVWAKYRIGYDEEGRIQALDVKATRMEVSRSGRYQLRGSLQRRHLLQYSQRPLRVLALQDKHRFEHGLPRKNKFVKRGAAMTCCRFGVIQ